MKHGFSKSICVLLTLVMALSVCLCACSNTEGKFPVALSDTVKSAFELSQNSYTDKQLNDIYKLVAEGATISELNSSYEIEVLRKDEDGTYRILYIGSKRLLVLSYDAECNWIEQPKLQCIYRVTDSRGSFDTLNVGDDVSAVQTADPYCYIPFLVDGSSDSLRTDHYTEDGYHTTITYNSDHTIATIGYEIM